MDVSAIPFVCPACKGPLRNDSNGYGCARCARAYPVICGIPDFRLEPDPYISIDDDRRKGERLADAGRAMSFEQLLRHYYDITPEDPPDLAIHWIAHALHEVEMAGALLRHAGQDGVSGALLDIGCSTGAMLIAAAAPRRWAVGVDVAFRWLVVGRRRLELAGVQPLLVCANAESLPFPNGTFDTITCIDVLEHTRRPADAIHEAHRVAAPGAVLVCTANNRYAPLPEPNIRLWGVGYLPRRWQQAYVARRRRDLHPYGIRLMSARELRRLVRTAGFADVGVEPAPVFTEHVRRRGMQRLGRVYMLVRQLPVIRAVLSWAGPRLLLTSRRPAPASSLDATDASRPSPSAAASADT